MSTTSKRAKKTVAPKLSAEQQPVPSSSSRITDLTVSGAWPLGVLLFIVFLVFMPTIRYSLVYDDLQQIVRNPRLTAWSYLPGYFTMHLWANVSHTTVSYYRPVFLIWLRLTYVLLGAPSAIWHLASILTHMGATACVFMFIRRLTGDSKAAALATGLFAITPYRLRRSPGSRPFPNHCSQFLSYLAFTFTQDARAPSVPFRCFLRPWPS